MNTIFGHEHATPSDFRDASIYVYYLDGDGGEPPTGAAAGASPASVLSQLTLSVGSQASAAEGAARGVFRSNVVVTRTQTDESLESFCAAQLRATLDGSKGAKLVRTGSGTVAGLPTREAELVLMMSGSLPNLAQWQVTLLRDGFAYSFYCTARQQRWTVERPRFEAFVHAWR